VDEARLERCRRRYGCGHVGDACAADHDGAGRRGTQASRRATLIEISDAGRALALEATEMLNSKVFAHPGLQQDKLEQLVTILTELRKTAGDFDTGGAPTK
jgi:hypothetical protein